MSDESDGAEKPEFEPNSTESEPDLSATDGGVAEHSDGRVPSRAGLDQADLDQKANEAEAEAEVDDLRTRCQQLRTENRQLRQQSAKIHQTRNGRISLGFVLLGTVSGLMGYLFPANRNVLFAIAATGLAAGLLIRYLNTETLIPRRVSEEMVGPLLTNQKALLSQLGFSGTPVYVPTEAGIRLVVPERRSSNLDDIVAAIDEDYEQHGDDRPFIRYDPPSMSGLSLRPSAGSLLNRFIVQHGSDRPETTSKAIASLQEGVTDIVELADSVDTEFNGMGRVTYEVEGTTLNPTSDFDHPVVSFLGAGLAWALGTPITVDVKSFDGTTVTVSYEWDMEKTQIDNG